MSQVVESTRKPRRKNQRLTADEMRIEVDMGRVENPYPIKPVYLFRCNNGSYSFVISTNGLLLPGFFYNPKSSWIDVPRLAKGKYAGEKMRSAYTPQGKGLPWVRLRKDLDILIANGEYRT